MKFESPSIYKYKNISIKNSIFNFFSIYLKFYYQDYQNNPLSSDPHQY
jgi:hypothetical protein